MFDLIQRKLMITDNYIYNNDNLIPAAVLMPLIMIEGNVHILFTKRSQKVAHHRGEISFPGGIQEKEDSNLLDCALRETYEEIGLQPSDVEILGELGQFKTFVTNFLVTCFAGKIPYPYPFKISGDEIDEILLVPLFHFTEESHHEKKMKLNPAHHEVTVHFYYYQEYTIWGLTGNMVHHFINKIFF